MKIIVPMAGMGKRMRPHTLTIPKPLIPVAGKPIVQRLVEDLANIAKEPVEEVAFVIGHFGDDVERSLLKIADGIGAKGSIHYQEEALGTAHAILCAESALDGRVIVAFADTLFRAEMQLDPSLDGVVWVNKVEDPSAFGVVKVNDEGIITDLVEKPTEFVSDLAIIGIYYFSDGKRLKGELQYLIDNDIKDKGEYQLTNALENMKDKGARFSAGPVLEWMDCGNKDATVHTNQRVLANANEDLVASDLKKENAVIIPPCYIGNGVSIVDSIVGPYASIGDGTKIERSVVDDCIIQKDSKVSDARISNSMLGNAVEYNGSAKNLSIGDYCTVKES